MLRSLVKMEQLPYLVERARGELVATPAGQRISQLPVTIGIVFFCVVFHLSCLIGGETAVLGGLAVSPSATLMGGKFWTVITSSLTESHSLKFAVFTSLVGVSSSYLEKEWGSFALVKHILLTVVGASLASALVFVAVYISTLNDEIFFSNVYGMGGLFVSLFVGFAKVRQEKVILTTETYAPERKFTIPALVAYSLLGLRFPLYDALLVVFSFVFAVLHLKSDGFTFQYFMPEVNPTASVPVTATESAAKLAPLATDPTKERFRQKGFKLLDKKLAELEATPEIPLDIEDNKVDKV